ncbi:hypothetical protein HHL08_22430 [Sphingobium sp. AR-3-1]|uniref:Polysaccharide pyruvyl transferase domain-containing protein n=1 Tax=Sphingobium psychrophilum TaxID=2728834 RepID=A0A7X9WZL8_9SPHN|nr:polysaccharide pyruvyl transferase family protein [Sphingobium psychrophilum]NML12855.1 hypothetical protein [Sphingobium psychrophilum]
MKIMFVAHEDFSNRGCEALVRSITNILADADPSVEFLLPSRTPVRDLAHWPNLKSHNVRLIGETLFQRHMGWWGRIIEKLPSIVRLGPPPMHVDPETKNSLGQADAVVFTGGDVLSLEYGLPSLFFWQGVTDAALAMGKPVHLWAASVGPFSKNPAVEKLMVKALKRYTSISVRESSTFEYLTGLGIPSIRYVADPAFVMLPEQHNHGDTLFASAIDGVLGFNVSPLVRKFLPDDAAKERFDAEIVGFMRQVIDTTGLSILLVPHVDPFDGSAKNSDSIYMAKLLADASMPTGKLAILPNNLNAAQLKYALGRCRFFIGARTHATIGALSQGVPTISIAYSVKAVGINRDLFGEENVVLPTPQVSKVTLLAALDQLFNREEAIRGILAERIPIWRSRAREAALPVLGKCDA